MILPVFLALFVVAAVFIFLDHYQKKDDINLDTDYPAIGMFGWLLMFLLGVAVVVVGLDYQSSATAEMNYTYSGGDIVSTSSTITYDYSDVQPLFGSIDASHIIGLFLAAVSAGGFVVSWTNMSRGGMDNED